MSLSSSLDYRNDSIFDVSYVLPVVSFISYKICYYVRRLDFFILDKPYSQEMT